MKYLVIVIERATRANNAYESNVYYRLGRAGGLHREYKSGEGEQVNDNKAFMYTH